MPRRQTLTPAERSLRARLASHRSWFNTDNPAERTAPARAASPLFQPYWVAKLDRERPDLPSAERERRAHHAWQAYRAEVALRASRTRRANRTAREAS